MKIRKLLTLSIVLVISLTTISSISVSSAAIDTEQELDLLHGETIFNITALADITSPFNISYVAPLNYGDQAPILFEVKNDTTANIIAYQILNDANSPNKMINFTVAPLEKGENAFIHFEYWVLVKNNDYTDLSRYVKIPKEDNLPEDTKTWLVSTKSIQSDNVLIRLKAKQVKGFSNNLIKLANRIVLSTSNLLHRRLIQRFHLRDFIYTLARKITGYTGWIPLQDALSALFLRGSCYASAHLGVALFRANGIPARSIIITPTYGKNIIYEQHVICEYYCPNYGWVPAETMFFSTPPKDIVDYIFLKAASNMGYPNITTPYETKSYIVLRVSYPEDENLAGGGLSFYGGMEPYMKINPREVIKWIVDEPPDTHGWIEKELTTDGQNASLALDVTQDVYELHTKYIGVNLTGDNLFHFDNALLAQKNAIECFNQSDVIGYLDNMTIAYDEYSLIAYP